MSSISSALAPIHVGPMINEINIRNFRCFEHLEAKRCKRVNVLVGDNGAGKTALLEAIFLTLSGSIEVSMRLKAQRGFDTAFAGAPKAIEEAIWQDYFYDLQWDRTISVDLIGSGQEARNLTISRGEADVLIPFSGFDQKDAGNPTPLVFSWRDSKGVAHVASPRITPQGIQLGVSAEDLPNFFLFPANHTVPASENAQRFSELSRARKADAFMSAITKEYDWIKDLKIEVVGGFPVLHASMAGLESSLPINSISGGVNRLVSIMLALAARPNGVILVDEIENGIYYKHKVPLWRSILRLARDNNCQLFLTTHDEEWLEALVEAADAKVDDLSLWRLERGKDATRVLHQFSGENLKAGIETGGEVR